MTTDSTPYLPDHEPEQVIRPTEPARPAESSMAPDASRTAQILRLAEKEAAALRAQATQDAEGIRDQAQRDGEAVRAQAQRDAADVRLAALAEAESVREQAQTESRELRADLESEADELVVSVWWLAERIRAATGKDPRDMPQLPEQIDATDGETTDDTGDAAPGRASEETVARHSALRRAAVAAQRSKRATERAEQESERTLSRARREAEELLNRARAEADQVITRARSEGARAADLAQSRVDALNRERDGILTSLAELMQHTADLGLQQSGPPAPRPVATGDVAPPTPRSGDES